MEVFVQKMRKGVFDVIIESSHGMVREEIDRPEVLQVVLNLLDNIDVTAADMDLMRGLLGLNKPATSNLPQDQAAIPPAQSEASQ